MRLMNSTQVKDRLTNKLASEIWSVAHHKMGCRLTHLPLDKMDAISQTIFSDAFSWMKKFDFWLKFHWSLFLRVQLTITQHWFRWWLGAEKATSHYLKQGWPDSLTHICGTMGRWVLMTHYGLMTLYGDRSGTALAHVVPSGRKPLLN